MTADINECKAGTAVEDFPQLGIKAGDVIYYRATEPYEIIPEGRPLVVRNVHTGAESIGHLQGDILRLADQSITNWFDFGAVVVGIVTTMYRNLPGQHP